MLSRVIHYKVDLRGFGSSKIYVISDKMNVKRRMAFIEAWSHFDGFNYEFVDAIMPRDFNVNDLLDKGIMGGKWEDLEHFGLTNNIIGIALSHKKVWERALNEECGSKVLILEDDARPSPNLMEYIYNGGYKKFIDQINKYHSDMIWIGRTSSQIKGERYTNHLQKIDPFEGIGAHAYLIDKSMLHIIKDDYKIDKPVDLYLDYMGPRMSGRFDNVFAPYISLIEQQGHLINLWHHDDPEDVDFMWSTGSQVNWHLDNPLPHPWSKVSREMRSYCENRVEEFTQYGKKWVRVKLKKKNLL
jgi:GR25 family glycosyltransferase involved in LPS biosynthesis